MSAARTRWCAAVAAWVLAGLCACGCAQARVQQGDRQGDQQGARAGTGAEARGWHFYDDPQAAPVAPPAPAPGPKAAPPARAPELVQFERMQKRLEELRNIAIVAPTFSNVQRYMEFEKMVVGKASVFADVAQRVAWQVPGMDPTTQGRPVNAAALEVYDRQQNDARSSQVGHLGKDHVLLFFFRSDCPYCHALAPTLKAFEQQHGITVVPVSIDGPGLPEYPSPRANAGIATALKVSQVPAVFLAQPYSGVITPVGIGVMTQSELLERITSIAAAKDTAAVQINPILPPN